MDIPYVEKAFSDVVKGVILKVWGSYTYKSLSPYGTQHVTKYYIGPRTWQPQAHSNEFSGPIEGGGLPSAAEFRDPGNVTLWGALACHLIHLERLEQPASYVPVIKSLHETPKGNNVKQQWKYLDLIHRPTCFFEFCVMNSQQFSCN
jgi:hypothetical protein